MEWYAKVWYDKTEVFLVLRKSKKWKVSKKEMLKNWDKEKERK